MAWTLDGTNPGPWTGAYPAAVTDQVVQHHWQLETSSNGGVTWNPVDSWDLTVDLDITRSPIAILRGKANGMPLVGKWVRLDVGWTIAGVTTEGTLFFGMVTARDAVHPHGGPIADWFEFQAESAETCWDFPANASHGISSTYTRIAQTQLVNVTWQAPNTLRVWEHIDLNSPTTAQLTAFRAMEISPGDNVDRFIHAMAEALGQRIAGDYRRRYPGSELAAYAVTPRLADTFVALNLAGRTTDLRRSAAIDRQATAVDITAQWISAGDNKQSRRVYGGAGTDFTRQRSFTINMKPTGGSLGANDPTALALLYSNAELYPHRVTFTARALWWLDPGMHVIPHSAAGPSPIIAITYDIDGGLMHVTLGDPYPT